MNHEAKVIQLRNLARDIEAERIRLTMGAPNVNSGARDGLEDKLAGWENRLRGFIRAREQDIRQVPFPALADARKDFSARQSLKSRIGNAVGLRDEAAGILADLLDIWGGLDGERRARENIVKALEKVLKDLAEEETQLSGPQSQALQQIVGKNAPSGQPDLPQVPGGMNLLVVVLGTMVMIRKWLADRRDK
ncbi:MAG: hypothetical protein AAGE03_10615 [Pseudomonadota bacterium]